MPAELADARLHAARQYLRERWAPRLRSAHPIGAADWSERVDRFVAGLEPDTVTDTGWSVWLREGLLGPTPVDDRDLETISAYSLWQVLAAATDCLADPDEPDEAAATDTDERLASIRLLELESRRYCQQLVAQGQPRPARPATLAPYLDEIARVLIVTRPDLDTR